MTTPWDLIVDKQMTAKQKEKWRDLLSNDGMLLAQQMRSARHELHEASRALAAITKNETYRTLDMLHAVGEAMLRVEMARLWFNKTHTPRAGDLHHGDT